MTGRYHLRLPAVLFCVVSDSNVFGWSTTFGENFIELPIYGSWKYVILSVSVEGSRVVTLCD